MDSGSTKAMESTKIIYLDWDMSIGSTMGIESTMG